MLIAICRESWKQNGKNIDFSVQKINFILRERDQNRSEKAEEIPECLNQLYQYSKSRHWALNHKVIPLDFTKFI